MGFNSGFKGLITPSYYPISVAAGSKARVCGFSLAMIEGLNPTECIQICLIGMFCVVRWKYLRRADHSSGGVLQSVVCLSVIVKPRQ